LTTLVSLFCVGLPTALWDQLGVPAKTSASIDLKVTGIYLDSIEH
jgi:hypothetical protein